MRVKHLTFYLLNPGFPSIFEKATALGSETLFLFFLCTKLFSAARSVLKLNYKKKIEINKSKFKNSVFRN